jgi:ATP-dependent Zn protease
MENQNMTPEQAKKLLDDEIQERINRCSSRISEILKEENCRLDVTMLITAQGNLPQLAIVNAKQ